MKFLMPRKEIVYIKHNFDIPEEKVDEYKKVFKMFDKDKRGEISANDITKIVKKYGYLISRNEAERMIEEIDPFGDGYLDFEEFVILMERKIEYFDEIDEEMVLRGFKSFDKDHDGKITNYEFRYA